jgi:hypothetical protein
VGDAWLRVKEKGGAAGADGVKIAQFKDGLNDDLYRLWNRRSSGSYFAGPGRLGYPSRAGPQPRHAWWGAYQQQRRPAGGSAIRR